MNIEVLVRVDPTEPVEPRWPSGTTAKYVDHHDEDVNDNDEKKGDDSNSNNNDFYGGPYNEILVNTVTLSGRQKLSINKINTNLPILTINLEFSTTHEDNSTNWKFKLIRMSLPDKHQVLQQEAWNGRYQQRCRGWELKKIIFLLLDLASVIFLPWVMWVDEVYELIAPLEKIFHWLRQN